MRVGTTIVPCHGRDPFHEVFDGCEPLGDSVFDPVFDRGCDFIVCRWTEVVEQVTDRRSEDGLAVVKARSVGHNHG